MNHPEAAHQHPSPCDRCTPAEQVIAEWDRIGWTKPQLTPKETP